MKIVLATTLLTLAGCAERPLGIPLCGGVPCDISPQSARAPRPLAPLSTARAASTRPRLRFVAGGGRSQTVMLCADRACDRVLERLELPATATSAQPTAALPVGVLFWQIIAHGDDGDRPSPTWELFIPSLGGPNDDVSHGTLFDVDGDGLADLALLTALEIDLYLGGPGRRPTTPDQIIASPARGLADGCAGLALATGDFDGDGYADLARAEVARSQVTVFRGGPDGLRPDLPARTYQVRAPEGFIGFGLMLGPAGDFDGDGYADLITLARRHAAGKADELYSGVILFGGTGTPARYTELLTRDGEYGFSYPVRTAGTGDFDGDGYGDVAFAIAGPRTHLFRGRANPAAALERDGLLSFPGQGVWFLSMDQDLDRDGRSELLGLSGALFGPVTTDLDFEVHAHALPSDTGVATLALSGVSERALAAVDLDGDGRGDLVGARADALLLFSGDLPSGASTTSLQPNRVLPTTPGPLAEIVGIGDFDGDGRSELVTRSADRGEIRFISGAAFFADAAATQALGAACAIAH